MFEVFAIGSLSWFISTMAGGGGAMLFVPLAGLIIPITLVVPAVSIAGAFSGGQRIYLYKEHIDWKVAKLVLPGIVIGAISGASLIVYVNQTCLALFLSGFYLFVGLWPFLRKKTNFSPLKARYFPLGGFVSSFMSGAVGTGAFYEPFISWVWPHERIVDRYEGMYNTVDAARQNGSIFFSRLIHEGSCCLWPSCQSRGWGWKLSWF
nr:sulfite exporter TauE/SafE family protein [uncultured Desulfuromonas sp.]